MAIFNLIERSELNLSQLDEIWKVLTVAWDKELSLLSYDTWISTAKPIQLTSDTLVIEVPSQLHRDYWTANLLQSANDLLKTNLKTKSNILLKLPEEPNPLKEAEESKKPKNTPEIGSLDPFNKETAQLNDKYTFENFVVGKGNTFAHAAAVAVSEEPGELYNPLFFYGGVGLGKTHLMHAIGHKILKNNPTAKVKYVTSEAFANDFIKSIQTKKQAEFRQEYRNVDVLLVDDIQFFADKVGTQEEFFHTFNALYDNKKQIVLTSDRLPNEIARLQARLVSRFEWGLSTDITPPDYETRIAILRNKAIADEMIIPSDTFNYVAGQFESNIRELEGALVKIQAYAKMLNQPVSTSVAAEALHTSKKQAAPPKSLTIKRIQEEVAKYYHLEVSDLNSKKRTKQIVLPRQIAMFLARFLIQAPLKKIGAEFGGKDHTTVMYAFKKISDKLPNDKNLQHDIDEIKEILES